MTKPLDEIKKNLKKDTLILGKDRCLKLLKLNKLQQVFLSSDTPEKVETDFKYYANLTDAKIHKLELPNDELGTFCKRPHHVSVLGLMK